MVRAMVQSYLKKTDSFQDLIPGKGAGLVILLHGPPGVGKTLTAGRFFPSSVEILSYPTLDPRPSSFSFSFFSGKTDTSPIAECVAESFKKPLYMVTAGDFGTDPQSLEKKLSSIFDDAVRWDAILLLDEADVFLQDRDYENLTRNALVSSKQLPSLSGIPSFRSHPSSSKPSIRQPRSQTPRASHRRKIVHLLTLSSPQSSCARSSTTQASCSSPRTVLAPSTRLSSRASTWRCAIRRLTRMAHTKYGITSSTGSTRITKAGASRSRLSMIATIC